MKRKVLFVASLIMATATFAQDGLTSKKGEAILPEAGDWALGFDAAPFINYFGNFANGTTNNSMNAAWLSGDSITSMAIVGKMFKDETTAYRAKIRIGFGSTSNDVLGFYDADADPTTNEVEFTNTNKTSNFNLVLGGGIEKRRGSTRIQGFYGAEALIAFASSNRTWDYGRDYNANWFANETAPIGNIQGSALAERVTERKAGSTFSFGLRAFIGVEWFIAPKVSLGAEYGWGLGLSSTGEGEETIEYWGFTENSTATEPSVQSETLKTGGKSSFQLDTDNNGSSIFGGSGQINLIFHF